MIYGYALVSTDGQIVGAQVAAVTAVGRRRAGPRQTAANSGTSSNGSPPATCWW